MPPMHHCLHLHVIDSLANEADFTMPFNWSNQHWVLNTSCACIHTKGVCINLQCVESTTCRVNISNVTINSNESLLMSHILHFCSIFWKICKISLFTGSMKMNNRTRLQTIARLLDSTRFLTKHRSDKTEHVLTLWKMKWSQGKISYARREWALNDDKQTQQKWHEKYWQTVGFLLNASPYI